jgi:hypothetical protein
VVAIPDSKPPDITAADTVDEIVKASKRHTYFPLRLEFLQRRVDGVMKPGPLAGLVRAGDIRGLKLYLLVITKASHEPYDAKLPAAVWARALGLDLPTNATARSTISKAWLRLQEAHLIKREREERKAKITLLNEDGLGRDYVSPENHYFRVPLALWLAGPDNGTRWYEVLSLPELAVLLIGRSLGDNFRLPVEKGPEWYGISADTIGRGIKGLFDRGLLEIDKRFKAAPLSPLGYTAEHRYTLAAPFKVGRVSGQPVPKAKKPPKKQTARRLVRRTSQTTGIRKSGGST